jgi:3',5'-cyclic AMP phosphodiesterase CpdA
MAISGNHETTYQLAGSNETYKHFNNKIPYQTTKKGYFYSFTYGNAKFIMLNTNVLDGTKLKNDQYEYLVNELKNNDKTWTFVALHNPLYSAGSWGSNPEKNQISLSLQKQLRGIFAEYGVDVVLQGHDHVISRTHPIKADGTTSSETWNLDNASGVSYSINPDGVIYVLNGPASNQYRSPYEDYNSAKKLNFTYQLASYERMLRRYGFNTSKTDIMIAPLQMENFRKDEDKWVFDKVNRGTTSRVLLQSLSDKLSE